MNIYTMSTDNDSTVNVGAKVSVSFKKEFKKCCSIDNRFSTQVITPSFVLRDLMETYIEKIKKKYKNDF
jgi:hypothetical protein